VYQRAFLLASVVNTFHNQAFVQFMHPRLLLFICVSKRQSVFQRDSCKIKRPSCIWCAQLLYTWSFQSKMMRVSKSELLPWHNFASYKSTQRNVSDWSMWKLVRMVFLPKILTRMASDMPIWQNIPGGFRNPPGIYDCPTSILTGLIPGRLKVIPWVYSNELSLSTNRKSLDVVLDRLRRW